jgi:hypothetical protein
MLRELLMIDRRSGFLAVICFGSSPTLLPSVSSTVTTGRLTTCSWERGEGVGEKRERQRESRVLYKSFNTLWPPKMPISGNFFYTLCLWCTLPPPHTCVVHIYLASNTVKNCCWIKFFKILFKAHIIVNCVTFIYTFVIELFLTVQHCTSICTVQKDIKACPVICYDLSWILLFLEGVEELVIGCWEIQIRKLWRRILCL